MNSVHNMLSEKITTIEEERKKAVIEAKVA